MKYNIKVGDLWLVGESATETIKGTVRGDTTAVFSRMVGEMSAYEFTDNRAESSSFDRITLCDYLRGIVERQNYGHYLGEIKVISEDEVEAQLPKRGKWVDGDARRVTARCSVCGHLRLGNGAEWANKHVHFCEVCGSKMGDEKA